MNQGVSLHIKSEMQTNDRKFERRNKDLFDLNAKRYQLHSCKTDRTPRNPPEMNKETSIVSTNVWWPNNNRWGVKWRMRTSRHSEHIENETEPTKARREVNKCCDIELCNFNWRGHAVCAMEWWGEMHCELIRCNVLHPEWWRTGFLVRLELHSHRFIFSSLMP